MNLRGSEVKRHELYYKKTVNITILRVPRYCPLVLLVKVTSETG